jgi:serine/threonine protein kinase
VSDDQALLTAHLDECATCRERLEHLAGQGDTMRQAFAPLVQSDYCSEALRQTMSRWKADPVELTQGPGNTNGGPPSLEFLSPTENRRHLGQLAGYEILKVIGRGGMGTVLKARDPKLERLVAVKVLNPELASGGQARARFLREARSAAAVTHEHVVTIHAVDDSAEVPFLVMEYIVGVSLEDRIQRSGQLRVRRCPAADSGSQSRHPGLAGGNH